MPATMAPPTASSSSASEPPESEPNEVSRVRREQREPGWAVPAVS
jgi:hypothetical protein